MFRGYTRFPDFQRSLGIATNILAKRLDGFVEDGLMAELAPGHSSGRRDYRLTAEGRALMPAIVALTEWGDEWVGPGPVSFQHKDCRGRVQLQLRCDGCEAQVSVDDVAVMRTARSS